MPAKKPAVKTTSFWMALVAILISLVGTIISITEAGILRDQQQMMKEEKAAAVWPYVASLVTMKNTEKGLEIETTLANKGVGPALISGTEFSVGAANGSLAELLPNLSAQYPGMVLHAVQSHTVEHSVLAAGEAIPLYKIMVFYPETTDSLSPVEKALSKINMTLLNTGQQITDTLAVDFCYCSIYGDCWDSDNQPLTREEACPGREMLQMPD
ncbi:hypothetical protein FUA23_01975 [Neolewinella aurantiaca]|uniref:Uncharacterized protein n=1 Tax=Neolewinella aurantiaca TaxID=2602767 RepID=A0A5C7FJN6_9BACT|nr:hypothetical protein [Neolewinella aurantiaca]TXF91486.1 hypothetical protein FUA23_01975 [Neolewinella aurantiaca]